MLGSYVLRFDGYADFVVDRKTNKIICYSKKKLQSSTIEHLLLDHLLPRLLSNDSWLVLHAGSVANEKGAIGFIGETGIGKSTLSTFLGQNGYSIVTDDCLVLKHDKDNFIAYPSYGSVRLNPDMARALIGDYKDLPYVAEYSGKIRLDPDNGRYINQEKPNRLRALFFLNNSNQNNAIDSVSIKRLSQRNVFSRLLKNTFRLDPTDKKSTIREYKILTSLVTCLPAYVLSYERQQGQLKEVLRAIQEMFV